MLSEGERVMQERGAMTYAGSLIDPENMDIFETQAHIGAFEMLGEDLAEEMWPGNWEKVGFTSVRAPVRPVGAGDNGPNVSLVVMQYRRKD